MYYSYFAVLFFYISSFFLNATPVPTLLDFWKLTVNFLLSSPVQMQSIQKLWQTQSLSMPLFSSNRMLHSLFILIDNSVKITPAKSLHFSIKMNFKDTLIQIWKNPYMFTFIWKQYPENFAFLVLRILELFAREVCKLLKKLANFYRILLFLIVCKQTFHKSQVRISQKVKGIFIWNLQHIIFIWRRRYYQIFKSAVASL